MNTMFVMIGLPGSGKSTYAIRLADKYNAVIVSSDNIRLELTGTYDQKVNSEVFRIMEERVKELIKTHNVIVDATNIYVNNRRIFTHITGCYKVAIFMNRGIQWCLEHSCHRDNVVPESYIIDKFYKLEKPRTREGFNKIVYVQGDICGGHNSKEVQAS